MRLRRLGWAGIELEANGDRLVIDHLLDPGIFKSFLTEEADELVEPDRGSARAALLTHLHRDHTDVAAVERAVDPDGIVLRPTRPPEPTRLDELSCGESEEGLAASKLEVREFAPGDAVELGPFTATALFASDGLGSPQVSWLVEADGKKVFHGGDTTWHGAWWNFTAAHGHVDIACLPGNGVSVTYPGWEPAVTDAVAVMTPEQAVDAAYVLGARALLPIHFNRTFESPEYYRPVADARERIEARAAEREQEVTFADPGGWQEV
jgi:L-ascorbate metabolism protein UlaG (beta-lactamase superfamily)